MTREGRRRGAVRREALGGLCGSTWHVLLAPVELRAIDVLEFRLELLPLPKRIAKWAGVAIWSVLTLDPVAIADSQIAVVRRSDGRRVGAVSLDAKDDVASVIARLKLEAEQMPPFEFAQTYGITAV